MLIFVTIALRAVKNRISSRWKAIRFEANSSRLRRFIVIGWMCLFACLSIGCVCAEQRQSPAWTTSRIKGTPDPPLPFTIERVFDDVELTHPTEMIRVPGTDRWVVAETHARIRSFSAGDDRDPRIAINMKDVEAKAGNVYGITFHPDYPRQPWCYIAYTAVPKSMTGTRLSRFRVSDTRHAIIDPESETVFMSWNSEGHSGGSLHFGSDGYLYISVGDGQDPNPPDRHETGQDLSDFEASVLRIDVNHASDGLPYHIPEDNPFVGQSNVRPEIWAYGFRNPWKMAFDPSTHTLWTGDVGWEMMEMVYRVDRGANYGWSVMEGSQVVKENGARTSTPITPPIVEHTHLEARSITGGYFWNADRMPELGGAYIYGDWMTGKIWALRHDGRQVTWHQEIADTNLQIICFALQDDGEVLVVGYDGTVHRLIASTQQAAAADFPRKLTDTGLFQSTADQIPESGVIPYQINAHHWADHTESEQWIAIPGDQKLGIYEKSDWQTGQVKGHFVFPHDAVLAKTVSYLRDVGDPASRQRLETQVLHRNGDDWNAYNYIWNEDQTDAILQDNVATDRKITVVDPSEPSGFRTQVWHHASRDECLLCHIWSASTVHGFKLEQLNRIDAIAGGNQLDRLEDAGVFASRVERVRPSVSPHDDSASLQDRARSYLHMNCAHCHRRGGGGTAPFELVGGLPLEELHVVDAPPTKGSFGLPDPRVVAAGDPYRSVLLYRMAKSGRGHMPQFGPSLIDDAGVLLIHDWIASIDSDRSVDSQIDLPKNPAEVASRLVSTDDALRLSIACCDASSVSERQRRMIADAASHHSDSTIRDLFERFLPEEKRIKRLGTSIDVEALLAIEGNASAGAKMYFESADVSCRQCHQVGQRGIAVGPDLSSIGIQRSRKEILESILRPSDKIEPKYQGKLVLTYDGELVSGLITAQSDETITIVEASGKPRVIASDDVDVIKSMQKSVMPDLMLAEFTSQQAADLLAFLSAQKKPLDAVNP